jgi:iron complex transport system substrate-binding protein
MRPLILLAALAALALPAAAQACGPDLRSFDHLGGTTCIPADPRRIVSLHDQQVTLPLLELDAPVVGSHGRLDDAGTPYMRSVDINMGLTFENAAIAFVGAFNALDAEVIAGLEPDLILGRPFDSDQAEPLRAIAPVVILDDTKGMIERYRDIAEVVGRADALEADLARFEALLADARAWTGVEGRTYSVVQVDNDVANLNVYGDSGITTHILDALGMEIVGDGARLRETGERRVNVSPELLPAQDADYVFGNYRIDQGATHGPRVERARFEEILPGFCAFLTACAEGRMILVPREHASTLSVRAWEVLAHLIVSNLAGRPGIAAPE